MVRDEPYYLAADMKNKVLHIPLDCPVKFRQVRRISADLRFSLSCVYHHQSFDTEDDYLQCTHINTSTPRLQLHRVSMQPRGGKRRRKAMPCSAAIRASSPSLRSCCLPLSSWWRFTYSMSDDSSMHQVTDIREGSILPSDFLLLQKYDFILICSMCLSSHSQKER